MKTKTLLKIIGINLLIFGALFGLVSFNKEFLRPLSSPNSLSAIFTGCFPNFIAAYLISLAPINAVIIKKPKRGRMIVYAFAIIVFLILSIEEIIPMWGASTYYDLYDIIASAIGSAFAILTYEIIGSFKNSKYPA
jgi:hypothetical protein